ncbi:MAG TPA: TauD/TfdA family dioxygenase [Acidimicrobiales bacterium]|nr:TauD/TfdA family dioxygenase [Acidimicrobiales bacterium]
MRPLTPALGAEVDGVQLGKVDDGTWAAVEQAYADHSVLVFRGQDLTPAALLDVGRRLGEPHIHPAAPTVDGHPEIMIIHADERSRVVAGEGWHTDVSCDERPPATTILWVQEVPPVGGDTLFASSAAAYDALSDTMKAFLAPLTARHESSHVYGGRYGTKESDSRDGAYPSSVHPVVRTHPVTGRKSLYVNRAFTTRINELTRAESAAVLAFLYAFQEDELFQCRVRWEPHTVTMWDNRVVQHRAMWDYFPQTRHGLRVSIVGEVPV